MLTTKVGENEHVEFHINYETRYLDRELARVDANGLSLSDHRCYYAIGKHDDICEYVVMDGNKEPVLIESNAYSMELAVLAYRMKCAEELDLREMAKMGHVPKVM